MDTSVLNQQSARDLTLIKWRTLHLKLGLAAATIPLVFITPSILGRNNPVHVAGRIITPVVTIIAGGVILKSAGEIDTLAPLVELIESQNLALLKHGLNSQTYVQTKTNTLYAAKTVMQLSESLEPETIAEFSPETIPEKAIISNGFPVLENDPEKLPVNPEINEFPQQELNEVSRAITEGHTDSSIVTEILGYTGRRYAEGKARLNAIKQHLGLAS